jgi:hypothetical protein
MTSINETQVACMIGELSQLDSMHPSKPFSEDVILFLNELSNTLIKTKESRNFPDVITFAYWCRKSNITQLSKEYIHVQNRIGLGLVFHITPANVPVNFAFSFVFSLLAGNSNVIRIPSKNYPQIDIICDAIKQLFIEERFKNIAQNTLLVKYPHSKEINSFFSSKCNARIVWGGDSTINQIRESKIPARSLDIGFADRYSFSIIDPTSLKTCTEKELIRLAENFYNDTYLMDQNACSSPHLIVWKKSNKSDSNSEKNRFWNAVHQIAQQKYQLDSIRVIDKLTLMCSDAINHPINSVTTTSNYLHQIKLTSVPNTIVNLSGNSGYFYEVDIAELNELAPLIETKIQTITYYGLKKEEILNFILNNYLIGVDRIVPVGKALEIGLTWDGYDLIYTLSRVIATE